MNITETSRKDEVITAACELVDQQEAVIKDLTGKKNTLVLATTKGFHKRHEVVEPGTQRLTIQFQFRINPFPLVTERKERYILGQDFLEEK